MEAHETRRMTDNRPGSRGSWVNEFGAPFDLWDEVSRLGRLKSGGGRLGWRLPPIRAAKYDIRRMALVPSIT